MVLEKYGSQVIAESNTASGPQYAPFQLHKLPSTAESDSTSYFLNLSEYGLGADNGTPSVLFTLPKRMGDPQDVKLIAVEVKNPDFPNITDKLLKLVFNTKEGEVAVQPYSELLSLSFGPGEAETRTKYNVRGQSERPSEIEVGPQHPYDVSIPVKNSKGDSKPPEQSRIVLGTDRVNDKRIYSVAPGIEQIQAKCLYLTGIGDEGTHVVVKSPEENGPGSILAEWYPELFGRYANANAKKFTENNGTWIFNIPDHPGKWGFTVSDEQREAVRMMAQSPKAGFFTFGVEEDPDASRPSFRPTVEFFYASDSTDSKTPVQKHKVSTSEIFIVND